MDIAVVGMDCFLPGSSTAEDWIAASRSGAVALSSVPAGRWPADPHGFLAPTVGAPDATPTLRGGFVSDPGLPDGVDQADLRDADVSIRLALRVVAGALRSGARVDPRRVDLLVANLALPTVGLARAVGAEPRYDGMGLPSAFRGGTDADRWPASDVARRVARALGLGGHVAALDAACASGLYAVQLACDRLAAGRCDVAVAAGVQRAESAFLFLGFAQLRALSPTGEARPFDVHADGLLVAEGSAAVALKRLDDARRDGDRVHAVIRGGGLGNDGRKGNLLAPSASGQKRALSAALHRAALDPAAVGYVEAHATGTQLGDRTELDALLDLHAERPDALVVSSTKGQIGHSITVAGLAGLIRAVGAVRDGFFPPTPGCATPQDTKGRIRVLRESEPWTAEHRVAGVSAFGFGGTNAHVLVARDGADRSDPRPTPGRLDVVGAGARLGSAVGAAAARRGPAGLLPFVDVDPRVRRTPPTELDEALLQQLAWLEAGAEALAGADVDPSRTAVVVGMEVDPDIARHTLRWGVEPALRDGVAPALTAGRVVGVLPNVVANRLSAALDLRGPSYTASARGDSLRAALDHAGRLLAADAADAVVVGVSDVAGRGPEDGAVAFVVVRPGEGVALGTVDPTTMPDAPTDDPVAPAAALLRSFADSPRFAATPSTDGGLRVRRAVPAEPVASERRFDAPFDGTYAPVPVLGAAPLPWTRVEGPPPAPAPLVWSFGAAPVRNDAPNAPSAPSAAEPSRRSDPAPAPAPRSPPATPRPPPAPSATTTASPARIATAPVADTAPPVAIDAPALARELTGLAALARGLSDAARATADAHAQFLAGQEDARTRLLAAMERLTGAAAAPAASTPSGIAAGTVAIELPADVVPAGAPVRRHPASPTVPAPPASTGPAPQAPSIPDRLPERLDREQLALFASGPISHVLGRDYADLDAIEPRVRLPMGELLLVSRVTRIEGRRGELGASRLWTEYDLDPDASWVHQGKPPPCVVVESGQADLLLCAILGTDGVVKGKSLYRLLDCDLTFHDVRPPVGETLCHDIRIKRFARYGDVLLFYFEYDCTAKSDGRKILTMREGCAGFFTPARLSVAQGVDPEPRPHPARSPLPRAATAPPQLDADGVRHLSEGRLGAAFGAAFAAGDGSTLRLPQGPWCLVHRVTALAHDGGPHGLGEVMVEQDLRDDDWFNAIHFKGDPCMPGTLMFDGCVQALEVWLLGLGVAADYPTGTFEPVAEVPSRLRCRGQVAPGNRNLRYHARIVEAGLDPTPWVVADVVLFVDGTPVVLAEGVSCRVVGEKRAATLGPEVVTIEEARLVEHAVGDPSRAFGPRWAPFDVGRRTPRIPGPPLLFLHRAERVDATADQLEAGTRATLAYDVPANAWYRSAAPRGALPLAILLEIALQPCGWLTAYEGAALDAGDVYFRNLGGTCTIVERVGADVGALRTTATLTSVSKSSGMILTFFDFEVRAGDRVVVKGDTHFGYFTEAALAAQKGLGLPAAEETRRAGLRTDHAVDRPVTSPRADLRMVDRMVADARDADGVGFVAGEKVVRPDEWFFDAHFFEDPVMPGSLGLEGLAQLAVAALTDQVGAPRAVDEGAPGTTFSWRYRGQVTRARERLGYEIDVARVVRGPAPEIVVNGVVRADGLAIYELTGLVVRFDAPEPAVAVALPIRGPGAAALLDRFDVDGDVGHGVVRLDPQRYPWLADHAPTLVVPALPMAFAAEIAAEAATLLAPGSRVVGFDAITAEKWIHTGDGPVDVLVVAVRERDRVAVTLALHVENRRFPALSGPKVHMRAIARLGAQWAEWAEPPPVIAEPACDAVIDAADYYAGGLTFHGPALHVAVGPLRRGPTGAVATLRPVPDAEIQPSGSPPFVLDPRVLDGATHPMFSGAPELWGPIPAGKLAYPVRCDDLRWFGPRPTGDVRCAVHLVEATPERLVFDVRLDGPEGPWAAYRWTEAIVDGGPVLGRGDALVAAFAKRGEAHPVHVGRATPEGWRVDDADVVEPIPGTLARLYAAPGEADGWGPDAESARSLLAAKEAVRAHLREVADRDFHPRRLRLTRTRPDRAVVTDAFDLEAGELVRWLGPTRVVVRLDVGSTSTVARVVPRS